jgi:OmpA-OmpF porin, OOP family
MPRKSTASLSSACLPAGFTTDLSKSNSESAESEMRATRRAEAVSAYLVQSGGVEANKIAATGLDEAKPVTKPGDCKGDKPTPELIACLQPDRRVEVEVTGTR